MQLRGQQLLRCVQQNPLPVTQNGTNHAYLRVHWWVNPACTFACSDEDGRIHYTYATYIVGPKNVPDGSACAAAPCNDP